MTTDDLLQALALPPEARLHLRVTKKELGERVGTTADRRLISEDVAGCTWVASLKATTCGLAATRTPERDYQEIAVLVLLLRGSRSLTRIRELLHRAIPYPLVLITSSTDGQIPVGVSLAHKRISRAIERTVVLEGDPLTTDGLILSPEFLGSLAFNDLHAGDVATYYEAWIARLEALHAATLTGTWVRPRTPNDYQRRRMALARHAALSAEITAAHRVATSTRQLSQQVASNLALHALRQRRLALTPDLNLEPIP